MLLFVLFPIIGASWCVRCLLFGVCCLLPVRVVCCCAWLRVVAPLFVFVVVICCGWSCLVCCVLLTIADCCVSSVAYYCCLLAHG